MKDAFDMFGLTDRTKEALLAHLQSFMDRPEFVGFPTRKAAREMLDNSTALTVVMYVNQDRWVGDCPYCNSGVTGVPGITVCFCLDCGQLMRATWPSAANRTAAETVLNYRPEMNRNWRVDAGETIADLKAENITRGLPIV